MMTSGNAKQYADQRAHDVAWMTAAEREGYGRHLAALSADIERLATLQDLASDPFAGIPNAHDEQNARF